MSLVRPLAAAAVVLSAAAADAQIGRWPVDLDRHDGRRHYGEPLGHRDLDRHDLDRRDFDRRDRGHVFGGNIHFGRGFTLTVGRAPAVVAAPTFAAPAFGSAGFAGPTCRPPLPPPPPQDGLCAHVAELAELLVVSANDLCLDLHLNYAHNPGFHRTYAEAYHVLEVAQDLRAAEHAGDRAYVQEQLIGLDGLFAHLEDDVRNWSRLHRHQIGRHGVLVKIRRMRDDLYRLMDDAGVTHAPAPAVAPAPGIAPPPAYGPLQAPRL